MRPERAQIEAPHRSELQGHLLRRRGTPESQHSPPPQPSLWQGQKVRALPVWTHFLGAIMVKDVLRKSERESEGA